MTQDVIKNVTQKENRKRKGTLTIQKKKRNKKSSLVNVIRYKVKTFLIT